MFINATNEFERHPEIKKLRRVGDHHINKIVKAYEEFKDISVYAKAISNETIKENNYNLNVTRYVDLTGQEDRVDVKQVLEELKNLKDEKLAIDSKLNNLMLELGYAK